MLLAASRDKCLNAPHPRCLHFGIPLYEYLVALSFRLPVPRRLSFLVPTCLPLLAMMALRVPWATLGEKTGRPTMEGMFWMIARLCNLRAGALLPAKSARSDGVMRLLAMYLVN